MKHTSLTVTMWMLLSLLLGSCTPADGLNVTPTPTHLTSVGEWSYLDPADPNAPALIAATDVKPSASTPTQTETNAGAFRLKPDWQVESIEYADAWWGLGKQSPNNHLIKREGAAYKLDGSAVSNADVQALVEAIDRLYPAQMLMHYSAWTDDYPSWGVEVTGTDGQHILLFASSTGNPGNGPWNVLYNGRLYAQYDGSIAKPLGKLFGGRLGKDDNPFSDSQPAGQVNFSTSGLPGQLTYGFWGLLPISQDFSYTADLDKGEIKGQITGSSRIGSMEIGSITKLNSLQLTDGGSQISCKVEQLPEGDPFTATTAWEFSCLIRSASKGARYRYPIKASFGDEKGDALDVSGELWGTWQAAGERGYILLPPPPEIEAAIDGNPLARDLMSDHILGATRYSATLTATTPLGGRREGEAILFGQTELEGKQIRYTVGAQFVVQGGKLTYWDLDRASLSDMLNAVVAQPLTKRVLEADPQAAINLWYAKGSPPKERNSGWDNALESYEVKVNACGTVPGGAFPSTGKPLQAFSYSRSPYFNRPPFVLINGQPVASELVMYPGNSDPVQKTFLPEALDTGSSKPFESIYMETTPYSGGGPTLSIREPEKAEAAEKAVYEKLLKALPVAAAKEESAMVVRGVTLTVGGDGKLQVVSCSALARPNATAKSSSPDNSGSSTSAAPKLVYSTYYGSTTPQSQDSTGAGGLAVDAEGNTYITGMTSASGLPLKDPIDSSHNGDLWNPFIAELDRDGSNLLYATYLGGSESSGNGITVDANGYIYAVGETYEDFPVENSPASVLVKGDADAYIVKLSPGGKKVVYATLLGGVQYDTAHSIAADAEGNAYVVGETRSEDFLTERPLQPKYGGWGKDDSNGDAFVAKISPDGSKLIYSTYLGGKRGDVAYGIAADDSGNAYVTGYTNSEDFPVAHPFQPKKAGGWDAFVTKISPDGSSFVYSTFLSGGANGSASGDNIAVDAQGNAFIIGTTASADFPLVKPLFSTFNGGVSFSGDERSVRDAFVAELNPEGSALVFSTFLGGSGEDSGRGIGLDEKGNIYVGGSTASNDFPVERPLQKQYSDTRFGMSNDSFIAKLKPSGAGLTYSTYFGVDGFDDLSAFAVDRHGNVYFSGDVETPSPNFPIAGKPFQTTNTGIRSAFIAKISDEQP